MYIAAHEDDTLLFQNPDLLRDIRSGRCVRTVFLTAGDAGRPQSYWSGREAGAEAAYAQMAGVADRWIEAETVANGHPLTTMTLEEEPAISLVYMRLPDGGTNGKGFPAYGEESLVKLWRGGNPGKGGPTINAITSVDDVSTYTYPGLIETLEELIKGYEPKLIATQNFNESFFEGDHPDHTGAGYFTKLSEEGYSRPHRLLSYDGYGIASDPENVLGETLGGKAFAFYAYGLHDPDACADELSCSSTIYASWLKRQYVTGSRTIGVVAHAGHLQEATPDEEVTLDATTSAAEGGDPLTYEWTQTKGPRVDLERANTAEPRFRTPSHPTLFTFSLVVSVGATVSEADTVTVRVPSNDPTPAAIAGSAQEVESGESVALDGSGSWDPNSLPLEYAWVQTAGPLVELARPSSPEPTFVAPSGPATVSFALVVSNGAQTSTPAMQTVSVRGIAPSFISDSTASFAVGKPGSFLIRTAGSPPPAISLDAGTLPPGVSLFDNGDGAATISGIPTSVAVPPFSNERYPIILSARNEVGTVTQELSLTVSRDGVSPLPAPEGEGTRGDGKPSNAKAPDGGEPPARAVRLGASRIVLEARQRSRRVVGMVGGAGQALRCAGRLPRGLRCRAAGRKVVIESTAALAKTGVYLLRVEVAADTGPSSLPLTIKVRPSR